MPNKHKQPRTFQRRPKPSDPMLSAQSQSNHAPSLSARKTRKYDPVTQAMVSGPADANTIQPKVGAAGDGWMPRFELPKVAEYAARVIIANVMDYGAAARQLVPLRFIGEISDAQVGKIRDALESSDKVREELEKMLAAKGLDETSRDAFVKEMWTWLRGGNMKLMTRAAAILGKGFIAEKVQIDKPEDLPIEGFQDGLSFLMGDVPRGDQMPASKPLTTAPRPDIRKRDQPERAAALNAQQESAQPPQTQQQPAPMEPYDGFDDISIN